MIQFFCIVCHAPKANLKSIFCQYCLEKTFKFTGALKKRTESYGGVPHYYLFDWNEDSEVAAKAIAYFLKYKEASFFEEFLSVVDEFPFRGALSAIAPPSSSAMPFEGTNHALSLAEALMKQKVVSRVFEAGVSKGVKLEQQKLKSREQRLRSNELDLRGAERLKSWIFVDDVLVSGGTFKSISESMFTKPKAIFTLFYKPRLNNKGFYDA